MSAAPQGQLSPDGERSHDLHDPLAVRKAGFLTAGIGVVHAILLIERGNAAEANEAKRLAARMAERALRLGGTVTGEHGIGIGKLAYMQAEHGAGWAVMGAIKRALDPLNILNPGKLVPQ